MCLGISPEVVVSEQGFTRLNAWLEAQGLQVERIKYSEIGKTGRALALQHPASASSGITTIKNTGTMEKTGQASTQITNQVVMIRPWSFRMNEETAVNNYFQKKEDMLPEAVVQKAQKEFDGLVDKLRAKGVEVLVVEEGEHQDTPDALFPNNWISFHSDGTVALYPMFAENRRKERREDVLEQLEALGYRIDQIQDYTAAEEEGVFFRRYRQPAARSAE